MPNIADRIVDLTLGEGPDEAEELELIADDGEEEEGETDELGVIMPGMHLMPKKHRGVRRRRAIPRGRLPRRRRRAKRRLVMPRGRLFRITKRRVIDVPRGTRLRTPRGTRFRARRRTRVRVPRRTMGEIGHDIGSGLASKGGLAAISLLSLLVIASRR